MSKPKSYWREMEDKYGWQGDRVKCRICGKVSLFLGSHIVKAHQILADDYKDMFGLLRSFPLVSEELGSEFSYFNAKHREEGKVITPETFFTSERNKGMEQPGAARKIMIEHSRNQVMTDEIRNSISVAQKKRFKNISPEKKADWIKKIKATYAKRAIYINCDQCGKPVRVSPSRMKRRYIFCNQQCLIDYSRDPNRDWFGHITNGHNRRVVCKTIGET